MDLTEAAEFVSARLALNSDPCLSQSDLHHLLELAAAEDEDGRCPDDDAWTPTYSVRGCYRAIAEGWTIKHGLAVGRFDFTTDGQTFRRAQMLDHIEHQRRLYARKVQSSPSTIGRS